MISEGKGQITPSPIRILLTPMEFRDVSAFAKRIADRRGYNSENCLIGYLGEAALSKHIEQKLNIPHLANFNELETNGDGGIDIDAYSCTIQVKTHRVGGRCLISTVKDKRLRPVGNCDYFVFGEVVFMNSGLVSLLGCISKANLIEHGRFENPYLYIDTKDLDPIDRLVNYLESLKLAPEIR